MLEKNEIIQSALQNLKIESLNPMQEAALEQGTGRKDVILLSPTGSGKTLAYLLPLLLTLKPNDDSVQVLILVPSRELALQIDTVFRSMGTSWKTCCCYGGHPIAEEKKSIAGNHPAIIIGTPGRITDHLSKRNFDPETIETLIIDEFDKSLEFGFHDEMAEIITQLPGLKKRMLLSATDAEEIPQFTGLNRTVKLDFLPEATEEQENRLKLMKVLSPSKDKIDTLYNGNIQAYVDSLYATSQITSSKGLKRFLERDTTYNLFEDPAVALSLDLIVKYYEMNQSISEASEQIEEGERLFNAAMRRMYACLLYTSPSPRDRG